MKKSVITEYESKYKVCFIDRLHDLDRRYTRDEQHDLVWEGQDMGAPYEILYALNFPPHSEDIQYEVKK